MSAGELFPLGLRLRGRRCVVVGGSELAHRRVASLLGVGAAVTVISPAATPALEALATAGALQWERRRYAAGDLSQAWYVVAASGIEDIDTSVAAEAAARRVLGTRADDPAAGTAALPAIGWHGGYMIGVHRDSDSGQPGQDMALRDAIVTALLDGSIDQRTPRPRTGGVTLVGGGPGDPGLLTLRGRELLNEADVVIADHLRTPAPQ